MTANAGSVGAPPLLSIVIVAYKSRDEIAACLGSLPQRLVGGGTEIVVVDNATGDGTGTIVREQFPWAKYIAPKANLGFGKANNLGYAAANPASEFVLFLNPDTTCNSAALEHCIARLRHDSMIGLISPQLVLADGSMDLACRRSIPTLWDGFCRASGLAAAFPGVKYFSGYNLTHLPEAGTYDVGAINGAFMMGRRTVFEAVAEKTAAESVAEPVESSESNVARDREAEPRAESLEPRDESQKRELQAAGAARPRVFDERFFMYGDDLDLCIRVAKAGFRIVYDGSVAITHLKGVSVAKDYEAMSRAIFDANREVYLTHFNRGGSAWIRWKYGFAFDLWKRVAGLRARLGGHRRVRPL